MHTHTDDALLHSATAGPVFPHAPDCLQTFMSG
jgi:hypothetical protein